MAILAITKIYRLRTIGELSQILGAIAIILVIALVIALDGNGDACGNYARSLSGSVW
ncbi:MAG: hypothetical protein WCP16_16110 [Pseudanabaena sp. ELA645]|jgi:hypothetical protein